jgi:hypothetical protein
MIMPPQVTPTQKFFCPSCNRSALRTGMVIGSRDSAQADAGLYVGKRRPINNGAALFPMREANPFAARGTDQQLDERPHPLA